MTLNEELKAQTLQALRSLDTRIRSAPGRTYDRKKAHEAAGLTDSKLPYCRVYSCPRCPLHFSTGCCKGYGVNGRALSTRYVRLWDYWGAMLKGIVNKHGS